MNDVRGACGGPLGVDAGSCPTCGTLRGGGRVPTVVAVLIGSVTAFFAIDGGHHTWPGGPTGNGGLDPTDFPASAIAWCASGLTATPPPVDDCAGVLAAHGLTGDTGATGS